jgi:hypothetical protein
MQGLSKFCSTFLVAKSSVLRLPIAGKEVVAYIDLLHVSVFGLLPVHSLMYNLATFKSLLVLEYDELRVVPSLGYFQAIT